MPAFTARAAGVADLTLPLDDGRLVLAPGVDHVVRWTPADGVSRVRLTLNSRSVGGHGTPLAAVLECETADAAGQLTVPATLLDGFPELDGSDICVSIDCPRSTLARVSIGYAEVPGGYVAFEVSSGRAFPVRHQP
ncbi:MAG: hypothetical protein R2939_07685 [Kofleriaceae bacterium]